MRWEGFRPLFDYWGQRIPRYYKLETLARVVERSLRGHDRFIVPSLQQVGGPSPLVSITFELFQEGKFQLIFLVRAMNAKRRQILMGLVVAKRAGDFSKVASAEHENLRILHERDPEHVVKPYLGGRIVLFEHQAHGGKPQEIYGYMNQWFGTYHELGVSKTLQFFVNVKNPQLFTLDQTEQLKGQIVEIIAKSYNPVKRDCMEMPQIASGDFVVTKPTQAAPRLRLIACRRLVRNMIPAKIVHRILDTHGDWGGRDFRLAPAQPETFLEGLTRALGPDTARQWLREYRAQVEKGTLTPQEPLTLEVLDELGIRS